jgi:hypothetical protein
MGFYLVPVPRVLSLPAPPMPPEQIVTEQDRQMAVAYEQWLHKNHNLVNTNLKDLETRVNKMRKIKKVSDYSSSI